MEAVQCVSDSFISPTPTPPSPQVQENWQKKSCSVSCFMMPLVFFLSFFLTLLLSYIQACNPKIAGIFINLFFLSIHFFGVVIKPFSRPSPSFCLQNIRLYLLSCYLYSLTGPDSKKNKKTKKNPRIACTPEGIRKLSAITFWLHRISDSEQKNKRGLAALASHLHTCFITVLLPCFPTYLASPNRHSARL